MKKCAIQPCPPPSPSCCLSGLAFGSRPGNFTRKRLPPVDAPHLVIVVVLPILDDAAKLPHKVLHLGIRPAQHPRVQGHDPALEAVGPVPLAPPAQVFELGVARPRPDGPDEGALDDVDEAGVEHHVPHALDGAERHARPALAHLEDAARELRVQPVRLRVARRVRVRLDAELKVLEPAVARAQGRQRLRVQRRPVADAARQAAHVDEVEGRGRVRPGRGGVVNFEPDVGRGGRGLRGGEVGAEDFGVGEEVGHVAGRGGVSMCVGLGRRCMREWNDMGMGTRHGKSR